MGSRVIRSVLLLFASSCASHSVDDVASERSAFETLTGASLEIADAKPLIAEVAPKVRVVEATPASLRWAVQALARYALRYPPTAFECIELRRVVLVSQLEEDGEGEGGFVSYEHQLLALAIDDWQLEHRDYVLERAFHHEFFHLLEHRMDPDRALDSEWQNLNARGFRYGKPAAAYWDLDKRLLDPAEGIPGFLSQYATVSMAEDKAELFSFLMWSRRHVMERTLRDAVAARKAEVLLARLRDWCPAFRLFPSGATIFQ
jgi:hypothetical protein